MYTCLIFDAASKEAAIGSFVIVLIGSIFSNGIYISEYHICP